MRKLSIKKKAKNENSLKSGNKKLNLIKNIEILIIDIGIGI